MNFDFLKPILAQAARDILRTIGTALLAHGVIQNGAGVEAFVGAGMTLCGLAWGWWTSVGHVQAAALLKKLTDTKSDTAAVAVAKAMPPAAATGAAEGAKNAVASGAQVIGAFLVAALLLGVGSFDVARADIIKRAVSPLAPGDGIQSIIDRITSVKAEIVAGVIADLQAADADASTPTNPGDPTSFRDPISHACYPAAVKFLQSLPVSSAPTGKYIAVQLFQKKRNFVAQLKAGIPVYLKLGCAPLLGDEASIFAQVMGTVGIKVGLTAITGGILPAGLPSL